MYSLRSVDVWSCAKIVGAIYGCFGLLFLPIFLMGGLFSSIFGLGSQSTVSTVIAFLAPILYGVSGYVFGAISAWLYNVFARRFGGIQVELKDLLAPSGSNLGLI